MTGKVFGYFCCKQNQSMKRIFTSIVLLLTATTSFAQNPAPCSDLFFSEYIEGTNNNKVLEIYNPTTSTIDLTNYKVWISFNGGTPNSSIYLQGTLSPDSVFVLAHSSAFPAVLALADQVSGAMNFNGDDAVVLIDTATNDTIDIIGEIGIDPGAFWVVGSGSTQLHTITRIASANNGQLDWLIGATEWNVFASNDFSQLGTHTMTPCAATPPDVFLVSTTQNVNEGAGTVTIQVGITNPDANATTVTLTLSDISASIGSDYDLVGNPVTVTFPSGSSAVQTVTTSIIDDLNIESAETFNVALSNPTNNATISTSNEIVTIIDNDSPGPEVFLVNTVQSVNENAGSIAIQVGITNPNANPTTVTFTLSNNDAEIGIDYDLIGNPITVTFPGGSTANQTVNVSIINDAILELDETFNVTLSNPTNNATLTGSQEIVTIINIEINSYISFWKAVDSVSESMPTYSATLEMFSGTMPTAPTSVTVTLVSAQSTATAGVDFIFNDTIVTWLAGPPNSQYAIFHLIDDALFEPMEHFVLTLSNFTNNSALGNVGSIQINIIDNDPDAVQEILENKSVMLIPNPANDNAILLTNGQFEYFEIRDASGRILQATNIHNQKANSIQLTDFAAGVYFICLHSATQSEVVKLMKQ